MVNKDYWSKLKLNECWSEKDRFNIIMNKILNDGTFDDIVPSVSTIHVTVNDEDGNPVKDADVSIYDKGEPYEAVTDNNGECTITGVEYGTYTIEATGEGFDFTVESITVDAPEISRVLVLIVE